MADDTGRVDVVECYKTSDGKIHESLTEAHDHQDVLDAAKAAKQPEESMSDNTKQKLCVGCRNNYYNGQGAEVCWSLKGAKHVKRTRVGTWQNPPYKWNPETTLSCHHMEGQSWIQKDDVRIK